MRPVNWPLGITGIVKCQPPRTLTPGATVQPSEIGADIAYCAVTLIVEALSVNVPPPLVVTVPPKSL